MYERAIVTSASDASQPSQEDLEKAISTLREFTSHALYWLDKEGKGELKDQIIANFIARGSYCLDSIRRLFEVGNYRDCVILQRSLADRMLLLNHLIHKKEFEKFQRWSRQRQYKMVQDIVSNPRIRAKLSPSDLQSIKQKQEERSSWLEQQPVTEWRRPKAKDISKELDVPELYLLSYDYPSKDVHPMADDGEAEWRALLYLLAKPDGYDITTIRNPLLVQMVLVHNGLIACDVMWRTVVMEFLIQLGFFAHNGSFEYLDTFDKLMGLGDTTPWCKAIDESDFPRHFTGTPDTV